MHIFLPIDPDAGFFFLNRDTTKRKGREVNKGRSKTRVIRMVKAITIPLASFPVTAKPRSSRSNKTNESTFSIKSVGHTRTR